MATFSERVGRKSVDLINNWGMDATDSEGTFHLPPEAIAPPMFCAIAFIIYIAD